MSNVNEKNKRINFLNAYQNVSSAPENQKVGHFFGLHASRSCVLAVQQSSCQLWFALTYLQYVHQLYNFKLGWVTCLDKSAHDLQAGAPNDMLVTVPLGNCASFSVTD